MLNFCLAYISTDTVHFRHTKDAVYFMNAWGEIICVIREKIASFLLYSYPIELTGRNYPIVA